MNNFEKTAKKYDKLVNKVFANKYGKKNKLLSINVVFKEEQFPHLIGLDYLNDIETVIYRRRDKRDILKAVIQGDLTAEDIEQSELLNQNISGNSTDFFTVQDRINYFYEFLNLIVSEKHRMCEFVKIKANSKIRADYLIKYDFPKSLDEEPNFLYFFIKKDAYEKDTYIPISFFPSINTSYFSGMPQYTLLKSEIIQDNNVIDIIYQSSTFKE